MVFQTNISTASINGVCHDQLCYLPYDKSYYILSFVSVKTLRAQKRLVQTDIDKPKTIASVGAGDNVRCNNNVDACTCTCVSRM